MEKKTNEKPIAKYLLMYSAFFIYAVSLTLLKLASGFEFLSKWYIVCLFATLGCIFIYSVLWQIILKYFPLSTAYLHRNSVLLFTLIISVAVFGETITINNIIGMMLIFAGIYIVTKGE